MKKKLTFLFLLCIYQYLIFHFSARPIPGNVQLGNFDKFFHILEYFPLALLWYFFLSEFNLKAKVIFSFIFSALYAISDEIHQIFVPQRSGSWQDVIADVAGIILALYLVRKWHR